MILYCTFIISATSLMHELQVEEEKISLKKSKTTSTIVIHTLSAMRLVATEVLYGW